jgi:SAM-dependent methyltransferase
MKNISYGEKYSLTIVDKFGIYLSSKKIINYVKKVKPKTIVDIGCGYNAILLQQLKKYSNDLTGVDIHVNKNIKGIKIIEKRVEKNLSFLRSNSVDLLILNSVLEHLDYPLDILKECKRILKKNGTLIVNVPNWLCKFFLEFSAFKLRLSPIDEIDDHKMYYDKKDLWPLLVEVGFKPSNIILKYHKFNLNTLAYAIKK